MRRSHVVRSDIEGTAVRPEILESVRPHFEPNNFRGFIMVEEPFEQRVLEVLSRFHPSSNDIMTFLDYWLGEVITALQYYAFQNLRPACVASSFLLRRSHIDKSPLFLRKVAFLAVSIKVNWGERDIIVFQLWLSL